MTSMCEEELDSSLAVVDMVLDLLNMGRRAKAWDDDEEVVEVVPTREILGSREMLSPLLGTELDFWMWVSLVDKSRGLIVWLLIA